MGKSKRSALPFLIDQMFLAERVLSHKELGQLYIALRAYAVEGTQPDLAGKSALWCGIFELMSGAQDKAQKNYEETCERNRMSALHRWRLEKT